MINKIKLEILINVPDDVSDLEDTIYEELLSLYREDLLTDCIVESETVSV